jgi:uncharacterized protein HemX
MSTPEETQGQEREETEKSSQIGQQSAPEPLDVEAAVRQLRTLVCGLGAGLLIVSLGLSAFVYKQNRNLMAATNQRTRQLTQLQTNQQPLMYALNELGKYSIGKPELLAIFTRHGIQISSKSEAGIPAPEPSTQ